MAKTKLQSVYNREQMKLEFFCSPELSVSRRLMSTYSLDYNNNGRVKDKVVGWVQEKKDMIKRVYDGMTDDVKEKMLSNLEMAEINIFTAFAKLSTDFTKEVLSKENSLWSLHRLKDVERMTKLIMIKMAQVGNRGMVVIDMTPEKQAKLDRVLGLDI